jgi:DNA-binding NtrC family response regulator
MSETTTQTSGTESPAKPRVLLVDDEPEITRALQRELRGQSYQITALNDSQQALGAASSEEFALIISDNLMPGLTGIELLSNLKVVHPDTRRILLTGHTDLNRAIQAFNDGDIHRYVGKPWDAEELQLIIRQEIKSYREGKEQESSRERIEAAARLHTSKLQEVFIELKEAKTQIALYAEGAAARRQQLSPRMKKLCVLVVDGHDGVRDILVDTLKKTGIETVTGVASGAQAIEQLKSTRTADVILSEWTLPDTDGFALYNEIRLGSTQSANSPFIFVTTQQNQKAVKMAIESGVNGYLIKPFHLKTLLDLIESRLPKGALEILEDRIHTLRNLHFLIVNADLDSRSSIQNMLVVSGVRDVSTAPNGHMAARLLEEKSAQVVIYDCNVRDPYWLEFHEKWKNSASRPALVITSVTPLDKEYADANKAGITTFLPGQVQRRKLFQFVLNAIQEQGG